MSSGIMRWSCLACAAVLAMPAGAAVAAEARVEFCGLGMGCTEREALRAYGNPATRDVPPLLDSDVTRRVSIAGNPRMQGVETTTLTFIDDQLYEVVLDYGRVTDAKDMTREAFDAAMAEMLEKKYGKPRKRTVAKSFMVPGRTTRIVEYESVVDVYSAGTEVTVEKDEFMVTARHAGLQAEAARKSDASRAARDEARTKKAKESLGGGF